MRAREHIATRDLPPDAVHLLVDHWLPHADVPNGRAQHEVALVVHVEFVSPPEAKGDKTGIGPWAYDEVILQLTLVAVIDQVDPGVEGRILHLGVGGHVRPPLRGIIADEVVGPAGQLLPPHRPQGRLSPHEGHAQHRLGPRSPPRGFAMDGRFARWRLARRQHQDRPGGGEKEGVPGAAGEELHLGVGLAAVGLEGQGELAVGLTHR